MSNPGKEPPCCRSSVALLDGGLLRIRTPEGAEVILTGERAMEWVSDRRFIDRLRRVGREALAAMPCPFVLADDGGDAEAGEV